MALEYSNHADQVIFVDLLAEGSAPLDQVPETELNAWIQGPPIPFTTATDAPGVGQRILKDFSPTDQTYLVELASLKILEHTQAPQELFPAIDAL